MVAKIAHATQPPPKEIRDVTTKGYIDDVASVQIETINFSNRATHDSSTPLVVGISFFDPGFHLRPGMDLTIAFRVLAAMGDTGITGTVKLRNSTLGQDVTSLVISGTTLTKYEQILTVKTVGPVGLNEIVDVGNFYEASISMDDSPGPTNTIEVYSALFRAVSTLP